MSRWSESRQLPRNILVTSWRLPRHICYGEVTGKLVPEEFELYSALQTLNTAADVSLQNLAAEGLVRFQDDDREMF